MRAWRDDSASEVLMDAVTYHMSFSPRIRCPHSFSLTFELPSSYSSLRLLAVRTEPGPACVRPLALALRTTTQTAPMSDIEKRTSDSASSDIDKDGYYAREQLVDPEEKQSLHRDLSARQISMIAVCRPPVLSCASQADT